MRVSVIIPCHNAAPYIEATLSSVAAQTLAPHEIIVVDDASTDESVARVQSWSAAHPDSALILLQVQERNAAAARNAGIAVASGDWVAFLDADDLWYPHHLQSAREVLSGGAALAYMANHHFTSEAGGHQPIPASMSHRIEQSSALDAAYWLELIERGFHFGHSTVLYRLDRLRAVGAFDPAQKRRHDLDLWLRVVQNCQWAYGAREAAIYRSDTPGSISKNVIESELFYLRALLKNRAAYPTPAMESLIRTSARRAMSLAFVDGTPAQRRAARRIAGPHLSERLRVFYRLARVAPLPLRAAIRLKRRWVWRRQPESRLVR